MPSQEMPRKPETLYEKAYKKKPKIRTIATIPAMLRTSDGISSIVALHEYSYVFVY